MKLKFKGECSITFVAIKKNSYVIENGSADFKEEDVEVAKDLGFTVEVKDEVVEEAAAKKTSKKKVVDDVDKS